jgi:membrane protease YdiL (CAAX protease family)
MKTFSAISDFIAYLSEPELLTHETRPLNWITVLSLFIFVFFGSALLCSPFFALLDVASLPHKMEGLFEDLSSLKIFLLAVILAPFVEEMLFRYQLKYPLLMTIFLILSIGYLLGQFFGLTQNPLWLAIQFLIMVSCIFLYQYDDIRLRIIDFTTRYYGYFFYWTAIVFAFIHSYNFDLSPDQWYYVPILVMPQFLLGLLLGYIRMQLNIGYAIVVHGLNNLIPVMALIFFDTF